eukprot:6065955-Alexandrium_andersonii.AAC.1
MVELCAARVRAAVIERACSATLGRRRRLCKGAGCAREKRRVASLRESFGAAYRQGERGRTPRPTAQRASHGKRSEET